jgi:Leucine-rich repeat (LRR) protein
MRKLMLSSNLLPSVPRPIASMPHLELLRLANNRISRVPPWLLHDLPALSWLALAGNPAMASPPPRATLEHIQLEKLELFEVLGEGTSGIVYR